MIYKYQLLIYMVIYYEYNYIWSLIIHHYYYI